MQIKIDDKRKELKNHGNYEFPVSIDYEILSKYDRSSFIWHWHEEIELTFILNGKMDYIINETAYSLKKGEGLFGNSNTLHMGKSCDMSDCRYISITFHPRLLYGYEGSIIKTKYVNPIINSNVSAIHMTDDSLWKITILDEIENIYKLYINNDKMFEIKIIESIYKIWITIYENNITKFNAISKSNIKDIERIKKIISFINENYRKKITLDEIAGCINICKSECCRFFKKHMKESLFDYLLDYRIERSLILLKDSNYNITEIAYAVGFSNAAYYSKIFKRKMLCTPREYRKKIMEYN